MPQTKLTELLSVTPTPLQQACVMRSMIAPGGGHYIQQLVCEWSEPLAITVWKQAWDIVSRRHDALRASFHWRDTGTLVEHFAANVNVSMEMRPRLSTDADRHQVVAEFCDADRNRGFDLTSPPLWRVAVFCWSAEEFTTVWTFHHSLLDGRSRTLVWREVELVYRALLAGEAMKLPPARPFREFPAWLKSLSVESAKVYWRERLRDVQTAVDLPLLASVQDYANDDAPPAMESLRLNQEDTTRLREAAHRHAVTMNNLVQGAWALAFARSQTVAEVIFGVVRSGRHWTKEDPDDRVGMFINTIPFRVNTLPRQSVGTWLQGLRAQQLAARAGEYASIEQIRHWCGLSGLTTPFRYLLMFENREPTEHLTSLKQKFQFIEKTDLPLLAAVAGNTLTLKLTYSPLRHSRDQVRTVLEKISGILEALTQAPGELELGQLPIRSPEDCKPFFDDWREGAAVPPDRILQPSPESPAHPAGCAAEPQALSAAERHKILVEWNQARLDYPRDKCAHQLFEEQAERTPDAVAVEHEGRSLTYGELNSRASQVALHLRSLGVKPEVLVGICMERSLEMIVGMLGIFKTGGAYVPMDPHYPRERLLTIINDSGIQTLLMQRKLEAQLKTGGPKIICLDPDGKTTAAENREDLQAATSAENAAYVIYTSGSTGTPKGVVITHEALGSYIAAASVAYQITPQDRVLQFASLGFDASIEEIFPCLARGGTLVLRTDAMAQSMAVFLGQCAIWNITVLSLPTAFWHELVLSMTADSLRLPASIRLVIIGGSRVLPDRIAQWNAQIRGSVRLVNSYGPTEATVVTTVCDLNGANFRLAPIGRPLPNVEVFIFNQELQPVPIGITGELFIGGAQLARGYLNRPELTSEKFIQHPFQAGARLYRTGDWARYLPDGNIEFMGRMDQQVKIRGYRVELDEIESVLGRHPAVRACAVNAMADSQGNPSLQAYLVTNAPDELSVGKLKSWLGQTLPDFMVPSSFICLDRLPLNSHGKLDRGALALVKGKRLASETAPAAPRNHPEHTLCEIWQTVLRRDGIGIHDNFFELGGHSLSALQVVARISGTLGVKILVRDLFDNPTIAGLAESLEQAQKLEASPRLSAPRSGPVPLSFSQERLWFLAEYEPAGTAYSISMASRLSGPLDIAVLERSLMEITRRHEVLRTTFKVREGRPFQDIAPPGSPVLSLSDLSRLTAAEREDEARRRLAQYRQLPFDLAAGPLFGSWLLRLDATTHLFLIRVHHVVFDGWSKGVLQGEISAIYAAFLRGQPAPLPPLPMQYADFSVWQRNWLQGRELNRQLAFWREHLREAPVLELPLDRPRPAELTYTGAEHRFPLPRDLAERLEVFNQGAKTTPFMSLLAAFHVLLSRYGATEDIVVGTPIANRMSPEVEGLIGFFVNTLAMRCDLSGEPDFRTLVARVRQTALDAYQHQDLPFEKLVAELNPVRDPSRHPLFQVMLAVQNTPECPLQLTGVEVSAYPLPSVTTHFDLELHLRADGSSWQGVWVYNTDLFEATTIERMAGHFLVLLENLLREPDRPVSQAPFMTEAERRQVWAPPNDSASDYPRVKCVHELFEEQVERTPEAIAVELGEARLTYGQLNARANQLARVLSQHGVGPDVAVAVCVERSLDMVVGVLGILKAGGAYVPLDPSYPPARLAWLVENAAVPVLVTQAAWVNRFSGTRDIISIDHLPSAAGGANAKVPVSSRNLAYILFTSGSTGQPKGVAMEHAPLVNLLHWHVSQSQVPQRTLQFASLSFDVSFQEMFSTWVLGGTLVLVDSETRLNPNALWKFVAAHKLERLFLPVVMLQYLAEAAALSSLALPELRDLITAGEQLRITPAIRAFFAAHPKCRLHNHYGPTESHVVSFYVLPPNSANWPELPPIGRPIGNANLHLLDAQRNPVPPGVPGELYIGGVALARGYWQQPGPTAERFVRDSFSAVANARLYRTGDRARSRSDGSIEYLGRLDQQVKIRGYRIEPGEVEAVLGTHGSVSACAVAVHRNPVGEKSLTAFVVARAGADLGLDSLRAWLKEKLPEYMIPPRFVSLETLPLTPNGKVDRRALALMEPSSLSTGATHHAPRTELQRQLADIWQEGLRQKRVGIRDNFFELGGHSLLAFTILARVATTLKLQIPVRWLFEHPTIEALSRQIASSHLLPAALAPMPRADRAQPLPMSYGQQQMWLVHQTLPDTTTYNLSTAFQLRGPVDGACLRESLRVIWSRHEVLRTSLRREGNQLTQRIAPVDTVALPWEEVDLRALPPQERATAAAHRLREGVRQPFDLAKPPLWRALWLIGDEDEHWLMVVFHHGVMDEWSIRLFLQEWARLYAAKADDTAAGLPELPVQYADYSVWQRQRLSGDLLERARAYWSEQLKELPPPLELPADQPPPVQRSGCGAVYRFELPPKMAEALRTLARQEETSLFCLVLAAFQTWLFRHTSQHDFLVGSPVAERERPEVQSLLGYFLNTLPLRARLDGQALFRDCLRQTRESVRAGLEHAALPFEQMSAMVTPGRELGRAGLYQVMFILLEQEMSEWQLPQVEIHKNSPSTGTSKSDLTLAVNTGGCAWICEFEYSTDLFSATAVEQMAARFVMLLGAIAANPDEAIGRLNLLPNEERQRLLREWNQTRRDHPCQVCINDLFEAQVERTPAAVAIQCASQSLTYRDLNCRANQLANYLRGMGVGPETRVGICLERSLTMVVGLLGILKAGGAYVPLDPGFPVQRLEHMIEATGMPVILTEAGLASLLPSARAQIVKMDAMASSLEALPDSNAPSLAHPRNLAYVLFTSGSTGHPKGVEIQHNALVNFLTSMRRRPGLESTDVLLAVTTLSFDIAGLELFLPLTVGARVVIAGQAAVANGQQLRQLLNESGATVMQATPVTWRLLLQAGWKGTPRLKILVGGEAVPRELADTLARMGTSAWNMYGPTETTVWSTIQLLKAGDPLVSIGRPIDNTQVYIVSPDLEPTPTGVAGELLIGGEGLARGYLNQPEMTAERFMADRFGNQPGARLYRTGDLARWRTDGTIECLGRLDQQVKIRGYRIELGEIESVLATHPDLLANAVVAQFNRAAEKQLTACIVARSGADLSAESLRLWLKEKLPDYMIPSRFAVLPALPLTPNGKVNRRALEKMETASLSTGTEHHPPRTELERQLAALWEKSLAREHIGVHDNFFTLGGHSLHAVRLATDIEELLGRQLPIAMVFQAPTIELMARWLTEKNWAPAWSSLVPLQPKGSKPPLFMVHGWGGDVFGFLDLAKLLPPDQPCFGVQAVGLDGTSARHETVEAMASHYAKEIHSFQHEGPIHLAGYSLGGLIAFEVARQIQRHGRQVALLALIDTVPIHPLPWSIYGRVMSPAFWNRFIFHLRQGSKMPHRDRLAYLRGRWVALQNRLTRQTRPSPATTTGPKGGNPPAEAAESQDYYYDLAANYQVRPYSGSAEVLVADDASPLVRTWKYMARGGAAFHRLPGSHLQLLSPAYVPGLAKALTSILGAVKEQDQPGNIADGRLGKSSIS